MPVVTKKHRIEINVKDGESIRHFTDVPLVRVRPLLTLLKAYETESTPWREAFEKDFTKAGGEAAYMLRAARERAGLTQTALARRLKMPQGNISQLESGKRPLGRRLAKRLEAVLKVNYKVFL